MTPIANDPLTNPKRQRGPDASPKRQQGSTASQPNPIGSLAEIAESSGTNESHIMQALQEYRTAREAGASPDRQEFLTRHADIATELSQCLEALDFVYQAAPKLQDSALEPAGLLQTSEVSETSEVSADAQPPMPLGDYQIIREIGRGGMGVVYEAIQLSLGRRVALKVLPFAAALDAKQLQRFKNEAHAAAHLQHQNIVPVHAVGCERGVHFYAMQFVEGQTLAALIQELRQQRGLDERGLKIEDRGSKIPASTPDATPTGPYAPGDQESATVEDRGALMETVSADPRSSILDSPSSFFRTVANLGIQAAEALEHAHQMGVIHRDIKPANLMIENSSLITHHSSLRLWITDFGLAHCQGGCELTMSGDLLGTLRYMSPEQALAQRVLVDQRTDIYSLGVTLYELLTLEPAFPGTDRQEILRQIAFDDPKPPRRLNKAIPPELETIVLKAMEKSPADRYATAQGMADDLERYLKDEPIRAKRPTLVQRARKWTRRHTAAVRAAVACLSVTLIVLASAIGWIVRDRAALEEGLDQVVERMLDETGPLMEQEKWSEALAIVQRADQLLEAAKREERSGRLLDLQRELSMAERLEEIFGEPKRDRTGQQYQELPDPDEEQFFQGFKQDRRFAEAFQEFGLDLEALAPAEAAARISRTRIRPALIQALDEWAAMRKRCRDLIGEDDPSWKKLLEVARLADPDEWRNRFREAMLGRDRRALEKLADVVPMRDLPPSTAYLLGLTLTQLGALDKAMLVLREAHRHHPEDFWLNNTLGTFSRDLQPSRYEDALRYYMAAVVLRPRSWHTHWDLANTLMQKRAVDEAIAEYSKSIELEPKSTEAWTNRGGAYTYLRKYDQALADFSKAIELDPNYVSAWHSRGHVYMHLAQPDKALADFSKATELSPDTKAKELSRERDQSLSYYYVALARLATGDLAGYRTACATLLERFGPNANWYVAHWVPWTCVVAPDAVKDLNQLVEIAQRSMRMDPETLGATLYRAGRFAEAVKQLNEGYLCWERGKRAWQAPGDICCFLAMAHHRLGHIAEARQSLDKAVKLMEQETQNESLPWNRRLTLQLLRREAEQMLKGSVEVQTTQKKEKPEAKAPSP